MPASHLPKKYVVYPTALSWEASPVMFRGMPAKPETGSAGLYMDGASFIGLTWKGLRPL